jgi:hypothetical protein
MFLEHAAQAVRALRLQRAAEMVSEGLPGPRLRVVQQQGSRCARCARCHPLCRDRGHRWRLLAAGLRTRRFNAGALRWGCICGSHDGLSDENGA